MSVERQTFWFSQLLKLTYFVCWNLLRPTVDNYESPGCEYASDGTPHSCYPLKWKTVAEYLQDANITWQVYQGEHSSLSSELS